MKNIMVVEFTMRIFDKLNVIMHCSPQIALIISCETHHQCLWGVAIESWRNLLQKRGRGNTNTSLPQLPYHQRACCLHQRLHQSRQEAEKRIMPKGIPITHKTNPGTLSCDLRMQKPCLLWFFNDDIRWKPVNVVRPGYDQIWGKLQPTHYLRRILSRKRVWI